MSKSELEAMLALHIRAYRLPEPKREYRFHLERRWRFDFAYPERRIGIEVEGGIWTGGRHVRGKGFEEGCIKCNAAEVMGWHVLRFTAGMIEGGTAIETIEAALGGDGQWKQGTKEAT